MGFKRELWFYNIIPQFAIKFNHFLSVGFVQL